MGQKLGSNTLDYDFLRTFRCLYFPFLRPFMLISWIFIHLHVCSEDIVPRILVIVVLILHLNVYMSPVMFIFMKVFFLLQLWNR
jgi:hypothetical protein